jgi:hypothetical protein
VGVLDRPIAVIVDFALLSLGQGSHVRQRIVN